MKLKSSNLLLDKCIEKRQVNDSKLHWFLINQYTVIKVFQ